MKLEILSDNEINVFSSSEDDTFALGKSVATILAGGTVLYLNGDLGAGKTLFTRGLGSQLGIERVKSPSFIIVAEHNKGKLPLVHVDLYRLTTEEEVAELDLPYYLEQGALLVIEWSERWINRPLEFPSIEFNFKKSDENENVRCINIKSEEIGYISSLLKKLNDK